MIATISFMLERQIPWKNSHWLSYTSYLVFFFVTLAVVDSVQRIRWVVLVALGSLAFASLYVLRDWQKYHTVYADFRPGWVVGDPNYFAISVLPFLPIGFLLMQELRPMWQRWFCFGCLAITLAGLMLSASRGGSLGLLASCLFLIAKSKHRLRNLAVIGTLLLVFVVVSPTSPLHRWQNPTHGDQVSVDTRLALWRGGLRMVQANPILGVGLDNFKYVVMRYIRPEDELPTEMQQHVAHNSYVEIAAEMGVPALLVFLAILFCTTSSLEDVRRRTQDCGPALVNQVALGLQAGLIGAAVAIFFVSGHYEKLLWLAIFLSMCMQGLVPKPSKRARQTKGEAPGTPCLNNRP